jgi:hypothetical protein
VQIRTKIAHFARFTNKASGVPHIRLCLSSQKVAYVSKFGAKLQVRELRPLNNVRKKCKLPMRAVIYWLTKGGVI